VIGALGADGISRSAPARPVRGPRRDRSAFYVMSMVEGRNFWDASFLDVPKAERAAYFDAMNASLAALHSVDMDAVGLGGFGRREGYCERQIALWTRQYLADPEAGRDPHMDQLIEWLPAHLPAPQAARLVHGDFRCDNMIFDPREARIAAVLDWELSTLGDPLADFAHHAMMYRMPPDIVAGLAGANPSALGLPGRGRLHRRLLCPDRAREACPIIRSTWPSPLPAGRHHARHQGRLIRGTAASAHAEHRANSVLALAALAWRQVG